MHDFIERIDTASNCSMAEDAVETSLISTMIGALIYCLAVLV